MLRPVNYERRLETEDRLDSMKMSMARLDMARAMMAQETGDWRKERRRDKEKEEIKEEEKEKEEE